MLGEKKKIKSKIDIDAGRATVRNKVSMFLFACKCFQCVIDFINAYRLLGSITSDFPFYFFTTVRSTRVD